MGLLIAPMVLIVAAMYLYIAVAVVPLLARSVRIRRRVVTAARLGAVAFFAGCAVTHLGLAVEMVGSHHRTVPGMLWWHAVPHVLQIVGGGLFIGVSRRHLRFTVLPREDAERLAAQELQFRVAFEMAPVGVALSAVSGDRSGQLLQVNPALSEMLGYPDASALVGRPYLDFVHPEDHTISWRHREALFTGQGSATFEQRLLHREGHALWARVRGALVRGEGGEPRFIIAQLRDITEERRREAELRYLAEHDALTRVYNRRRFTEELDLAVQRGHRHHEPAALLVVDIDQFKYVNDTHGHRIGDQLLAAVARAIKQRVRATDVIGRLGGDEFAVLCPRTRAEDVRAVAGGLLESIRRDVTIHAEGRVIRCAASIGITVIEPGLEVTAEQLLADADLAMYEAKEAGRDRVTMMGHGAAVAAVRSRLAWAERIRDALANDGFRLWEQPIRNLATGICDRSELLLRMIDPTDGSLVGPGAFLPAAERFGQIQAIDRWVFQQAITLLGVRGRAGDERTVEVNLSGASLTDEDFIDELTRLIAEAPIDPSRLMVEITETAAVRNFDLARSLAHRLRDLGCRFVVDDFGSGFGSFYYLKHLPVDGLKIDGEFVKDLPDSLVDRLTVEALVTLSRGLDKELTAEFVQDEQTAVLLAELGVGFAQGYHIGRPRPVPELDSTHGPVQGSAPGAEHRQIIPAG